MVEVGDKRAKHYGRAYQCLRCLHRDNKEVIDVKRRMLGHIMKTHLSLDEVPHYCRLCQFRCMDRATLERHVKNYARHKRAMSGRQDSEEFLVSNKAPYQIGQMDMVILSKERSLEFFKGKGERDRETHPKGDLLSQAVQEAQIPQALSPSLQSILDDLNDVPSVKEIDTVSRLSTPTFCMPEALRVPPGQLLATPCDTLTPLDLSVSRAGSVVEDILPQILPEEETAFEEPPAKRPRQEAEMEATVPASPAASGISTASSETCQVLTADQMECIAKSVGNKICKSLQENTNALKDICLVLKDLTKASEYTSRSLKAIQEVMEEGKHRREKENREERTSGRNFQREPFKPRRY